MEYGVKKLVRIKKKKAVRIRERKRKQWESGKEKESSENQGKKKKAVRIRERKRVVRRNEECGADSHKMGGCTIYFISPLYCKFPRECKKFTAWHRSENPLP